MSFLSELRQVTSPSRPLHVRPASWMPRNPHAAPGGTPHPFAKAFACAVLTYAASTAALVAVVMPNVPADVMAAGSLAGALCVFAVASFVPAFVTGMIVRQSRQVWGVARIAAAYVPLFLLIAALQLVHTREVWQAGLPAGFGG
jgi:hypothetical protein